MGAQKVGINSLTSRFIATQASYRSLRRWCGRLSLTTFEIVATSFGRPAIYGAQTPLANADKLDNVST
jgi:hypothetical protein